MFQMRRGQFNTIRSDNIVDNQLSGWKPRRMPKATVTAAPKGPSGAEIADWIRERIRNRRFVPGQRLVEFDITRNTGGSRFKVREALQRLEAEGLVTLEEYRGASVRSATMEEVRQLYRARAVLEGLCAADFARNATLEQRVRLKKAEEALERAVNAGTTESFSSLNGQWHTLIMEGSGNRVLHGLIQRLNTPVHHLVFENFYRADRLLAALVDHNLILDAIMKGDAEGAEIAMRRHVENGFRYLMQLDRAVHSEEGTL
jgi:DNA-binding GntR family transcriptional regulator